jgi:hypothetical protein
MVSESRSWVQSCSASTYKSILRLISTLSVASSPLGKFVFCASRQLLNSSTSSPRVYCIYSSSSFASVSTSVVVRVGIVGVLE